ncbi:MAG: phage head morphogenesis protein [Rhodocyclaceae bacterium]|nr:phage head morphogenesis protein [Rhodocyclaceae bacterium]
MAKFQAEGGTFEDFRQWAGGQDWSLPRHRLETIYRNAVQTAYMAGHWRRFEEVAEDYPYLMYDAINDSRVRPSHLAMDGVIRPVNDPIWRRWSPPCGHRCRCTLRQVSAAEARRRGGVTPNLPAEGGPDEGWGNDPRQWSETLRSHVQQRRGMCDVATFGYKKPNQPIWCHGHGAELIKRLDYALQIGKRSQIEPLAMRYRILTYIQQAEATAGQLRQQMVIGVFTRQGDLFDVVSRSGVMPAGAGLSRLLFINRVALQAHYLMHIKHQHAPGGVKSDRGFVMPEIVLAAADAANSGKLAPEVRIGPNGNPMVSTLFEVDGALYRFVWEAKIGRRSLTLFSLYPIETGNQMRR